jgi:hypothetical protein
MREYFLTNGTDSDSSNQSDHWGNEYAFKNNLYNIHSGFSYIENKTGLFGNINILIYEPCNYASNIAYYHSTTRICDYPNWSLNQDQLKAFKRIFGTLAIGSAFWHGSYTHVGHSFDTNMIAVISYLAHQATIGNLPSNSSIFKELSTTQRSKSAIEVVEELIQVINNQPAKNWKSYLDNLDIPHDYYVTFSAIIATGISFVFPWSFV